MNDHLQAESDLGLGSFVAALRKRWISGLTVGLLATGAVIAMVLTQTPKYESVAELTLRTEQTATLFAQADGIESYVVKAPLSELIYVNSDTYRQALLAAVGESVEIEVTEPGEIDETFGNLRFRAVADDPVEAAEAARTAALLYIESRHAPALASFNDEIETLTADLDGVVLKLDELTAPLTEIDRQISQVEASQDLAQLVVARNAAADAIERQRSQLEARAESLEERLEQLLKAETLMNSTEAFALVAVEPQVAARPFSPNWPQMIALAIVLGAVLGAGFAVTRDVLDNRIFDAATLQALGHTVLSTVPLKRGSHSTARAFRTTTSPIRSSTATNGPDRRSSSCRRPRNFAPSWLPAP